jgi:uncharacterized protein YjbI with pentapeptide repeats
MLLIWDVKRNKWILSFISFLIYRQFHGEKTNQARWRGEQAQVEHRTEKHREAIRVGDRAYLTPYGAVITGAVINGADMTGAVITGADMIGAVITGADMIGAVITGADMTGAVITGADMIGAVITGADMTGAAMI